MECRFCGAKLQPGMETCPECGLEVLPEDKKKKSGWRIALAVIAGVVLLAVLAGFVLNSLGVVNVKELLTFEKKENNVFYKDSYTADEKTVSKKANVVIATVGDKKLDNGTFQFYYAMDVMDFINQNSYYLSYMGLDYTMPLDEQFANEEEGITWQQMFIDSAIADWYNYTLMNLLAEEEGFTISAEMQASIDGFEKELQDVAISNGFVDAQTMINSDFGAGYNVDNYLRYLEERYRAVDYVSHLYQSLKPTAEEVETYFAENEDALAEAGITKDAGFYGNVRHILIQPEGGETNEDGQTVYSEEAWTACQTEAQRIVDEWLAGDANEESFAQLANQYSQDPGSNTTGGIYTGVREGEMVEEFDAWLFFQEHQYGDYGLVKTEFGYHIMFFVSVDEIWAVETENQMISEKIEEKVKAAEETWPIEKEYKKIVLSDLKLT
ncbi:MAG: peptidylprolyl isomerase [Oscillospiraceae bacterium]|nr:peptidylprolyl isomerase [Oscillospiraceae bacterium]